jgi:hypothetical protein
MSQGPLTSVLVEVDQVASLREAYPNYYLDVRLFTQNLRNMLTNEPVDRALKTDEPITKSVRGFDLSFLNDWPKRKR